MSRHGLRRSISRFGSALGAVLLASCASHTGQFSATPPTGPVEYRGLAAGESHAWNVLGIGGAGRTNLLLEARQDLVRRRPLADGESYANFVLDETRVVYPFCRKTTYVLSADVVASLKDNAARIYSKAYAAQMGMSDSVSSFPTPGDTLRSKDGRRFVMVAGSSNGDAYVVDLATPRATGLVKLDLNDLFAISGARSGVEVGDTLEFFAPQGVRGRKGIVLGLGVRDVLVKEFAHVQEDVEVPELLSRLPYGEIEDSQEIPVLRK